MPEKLSRVAETLKRLVPYINTGNYTEFLEYTVFGATDAEEILESLGRSPSDREDTSRIDAVSKLAGDLKAHRGRKQLAERVSIDQEPKFKSDAFDGFSPTDPLRKVEQILQEYLGPVRQPGTVSEGADEDDLGAAIVMEFLGRVSKAVNRTISLDQLRLNKVPDQDVKRYFGEAHLCYLCGFNVACVVLCRAILACALGRRYPPKHVPDTGKPQRSPGLKSLIEKASKDGLFKNVPRQWVDDVKDAGDNAIHDLPTFELRWDGRLDEVLLYTRKVLEDLYMVGGPVP